MPAHKKTDPVCLIIAKTIAEEERVDPIELEPLYSTLDTDALESLIESSSTQDLRVQFEYCDYTVTVNGGGHVDVN